MNGQRLLFLHLLLAGHEEHVLVTQGDVGKAARQDALQVNRKHFQRAVRLHAVQDGVGCEGFFRHAFGCLYQLTDALDVTAHLIHARTEYSTLDFNHVRVTRQNGIHADGVLVAHGETCQVKLADVIHGVL